MIDRAKSMDVMVNSQALSQLDKVSRHGPFCSNMDQTGKGTDPEGKQCSALNVKAFFGPLVSASVRLPNKQLDSVH